MMTALFISRQKDITKAAVLTDSGFTNKNN